MKLKSQKRERRQMNCLAHSECMSRGGISGPVEEYLDRWSDHSVLFTTQVEVQLLSFAVVLWSILPYF